MELKVIMMALESLSSKMETVIKENKQFRIELEALKRVQQRPEINPISQKNLPNTEDELLTIKSARNILGIGRSSFLNLVKIGLIHPIRINMRTIRYSRLQLQEYIKSKL